MKVLIVNGSLHEGSTGKIAYGLHEKLIENNHESLFVYGDYLDINDNENEICISNKQEQFVHKVLNCITGYNSNYAPFSMHRIEKIIKNYRPDIIQLYNLHGYYLDIYKLFKLIHNYNIPIVYGMLDEHPYLGYCTYAYDCDKFKTGCSNCSLVIKHGYMNFWTKNRGRQTFLLKKKAYDSIKKIIFTGPGWVIDRAKESLLLKDKSLEVLDEYIDTEKVFVPRDASSLREKLGISENDIVALNVARSDDPRKGVSYYLELARDSSSNVKFINIGYNDEICDLPSNYIPISYVANQEELATYYSLADILICTSLADTMPNVCLDALSCGTPVCGFNISGTPYVADEPIGKFVDVGDIKAMQKIIDDNGKKTSELSAQCREYAINRYSITTYYERTMKIYNELISKDE